MNHKGRAAHEENGTKMTPEEYLTLENAAPYRSEFYDGAMLAMADRSYANAVINTNLMGLLHPLARKASWHFFSSGMRVCIQDVPIYTYPDASVVREPLQLAVNSDTTLVNPCLIMEVLSPTGESYERRATFQHFQRVTALKDYVTISQEEPFVAHYARLDEAAPGKWLYTAYEGLDAVLLLPSLNVQLPLQEIYERVEFPPPGRTLNKKHPLHGKIF